MAPSLPRENALLAALPHAEREVVHREAERVKLLFRDVLQGTERPLEHVWFPLSGVCSAITTMQDGAVVEVATIGREGFVGMPLVLGATRMAQDIFVQIPGEAHRLSAAAFMAMQADLPALRTMCLRYTLAMFSEISQCAACNRLHPLEARCARWMLMTHDRVEGDSFPLTQEFLGHMLGVTRPSVSVAAGMLQRAGYIQYVRGRVDVLDRSGLESAACECYGVISSEFHRLASEC